LRFRALLFDPSELLRDDADLRHQRGRLVERSAGVRETSELLQVGVGSHRGERPRRDLPVRESPGLLDQSLAPASSST
jgi:hypothetical protein